MLVAGAVLATAGHVFHHHRGRRELTRPAALLVALVAVQATLGAFVVLSGLQPFINTLHVVNGALVLGTSLVLTLRSWTSLGAREAGVRVPDGRAISGSGFGLRDVADGEGRL